MISIIVPVYNTADYLDACISSIVAQQYTDLEILLIDDCSSDGSVEILDSWAKKDLRIKVVHLEKNGGVSAARNVGLQMATGEHVGFVDSDDLIEPNFYSELYKWICEKKADIALGGYKRLFENNITIERLPLWQSGTVVTTEEALASCMPQRGAGRYDLFIWDKLFKKSCLYSNGELIQFDSRYSHCEDVLWLVRVFLNANRAVIWKGTGYYYRSAREGNTWTALNNFADLPRCKSALESNLEVFRLLAARKSTSANNAFQRVLFYQKYAFRTAAAQGDRSAYQEYHKGYISGLIRWAAKNRSFMGLRWTVRQIGADILFSLGLVK